MINKFEPRPDLSVDVTQQSTREQTEVSARREARRRRCRCSAPIEPRSPSTGRRRRVVRRRRRVHRVRVDDSRGRRRAPRVASARSLSASGPCRSGGSRARVRAADAAAASSSPSADTNAPARLVLYTKPGCCLCDGLKERLDEVLASDAMASAPALVGASLELRDVSTNEEWATKHAMEVPVLRLLDDDGGDGGEREIPLPRPAPRLSAARLAIRLGQDVDAARGGDGGSSRKGWSVRTGGGAEIGAAAAAAPSSSPSGWSVVSDKGW